MSFAASIITLFPEAFPGTLGLSLIGKALTQGAWSLETVNLREFGIGAHKRVDDTPAGGGAGMVIRADVAAAAIDHVLGAPASSRHAAPANAQAGAGLITECRQDAGAPRPLIYLSPRGKQFSQAMAREWAAGPGLVLFCGRFEGLDERAIEARGMREIAVGEAVLAGGEAAALVVLEACVRLLPGVLGNETSVLEESFSDNAFGGLLEHPQYTRPREWEGRQIPDVLLSGDHAKVEAWRRFERERITARPKKP
jgi:tRNA (guanine37-N1)-methyltransferase